MPSLTDLMSAEVWLKIWCIHPKWIRRQVISATLCFLNRSFLLSTIQLMGWENPCDSQHHSIGNMNAIVVSSRCTYLAYCVSVTNTGKTLCGGHRQLRSELSSLSPNGFESNLSHRCKRYQPIFMGIQDIQGIHHMLTSRSWQKTYLAQLLTCLGVRPMTWSSSHDSLGDPGTPQLVFQKFYIRRSLMIYDSVGIYNNIWYIGTWSILYHFAIYFFPSKPFRCISFPIVGKCCWSAARLGLALKMPTGVRGNPRGRYMGVSLNGGFPPKHPKMIIFSRKTHGCWGNPPF